MGRVVTPITLVRTPTFNLILTLTHLAHPNSISNPNPDTINLTLTITLTLTPTRSGS